MKETLLYLSLVNSVHLFLEVLKQSLLKAVRFAMLGASFFIPDIIFLRRQNSWIQNLTPQIVEKHPKNTKEDFYLATSSTLHPRQCVSR